MNKAGYKINSIYTQIPSCTKTKEEKGREEGRDIRGEREGQREGQRKNAYLTCDLGQIA